MAKTFVRIEPAKASCEAHNKREKELDYVRKDLSASNECCINVANLGQHRRELAILVKEKTGRKMQAKAQPLQEAVVGIAPDTTMDQLRSLAERFRQEWGVAPLQIFIHRDEGHWEDTSGITVPTPSPELRSKFVWKPNLHAHIVFDWIDHKTGRTIRTTREDARRMQSLAAECLGMERGESSNRKHLDPQRYKAQLLAKEVRELERSIQNRETSRNGLIFAAVRFLKGKQKESLENELNEAREAKNAAIERARESVSLKVRLEEEIHKQGLRNDLDRELLRQSKEISQRNGELQSEVHRLKLERDHLLHTFPLVVAEAESYGVRPTQCLELAVNGRTVTDSLFVPELGRKYSDGQPIELTWQGHLMARGKSIAEWCRNVVESVREKLAETVKNPRKFGPNL